jgi:hypothetical protein
VTTPVFLCFTVALINLSSSSLPSCHIMTFYFRTQLILFSFFLWVNIRATDVY